VNAHQYIKIDMIKPQVFRHNRIDRIFLYQKYKTSTTDSVVAQKLVT